MLAEIGRVLRPGGRLVIELAHRDALISRFREQDWRLLGEGRLLLEQRTFDPEAGVAQSTQTLIDGAGARESRTFSVRCYTATELLRMLASAGFGECKCYGDLSGAPFTTTSRLVIVAPGARRARGPRRAAEQPAHVGLRPALHHPVALEAQDRDAGQRDLPPRRRDAHELAGVRAAHREADGARVALPQHLWKSSGGVEGGEDGRVELAHLRLVRGSGASPCRRMPSS